MARWAIKTPLEASSMVLGLGTRWNSGTTTARKRSSQKRKKPLAKKQGPLGFRNRLLSFLPDVLKAWKKVL